MGWFSRKVPEPKVPAYRQHNFEPKDDMTAQELALILKVFTMSTGPVLEDPFHFPAFQDPKQFFFVECGKPEIGRHFGEQLALVDEFLERV